MPIPRSKEEREKEQQRLNNSLLQSSLVAPGVGLAASGVRGLINKPNEIGFTYGTDPWMGEGHKAPGEAMAAFLEQHPDLKKYKFVQMGVPAQVGDAPRQIPAAWQTNKKLLALIDSGFGVGHPDVQGSIPNVPKINYLTDMPSPYIRELQTFSHPSQADRSVLYYGSEQHMPSDMAGKQIQKPTYNVGAVSPAFHPAVRDLVTQGNDGYQVNKPPRQDYEKLLTSMTDSDGKPLNIEAKTIRGKKIIAISGSGRGDFVGERARQIAEHLKATGRNDVVVLAAAAGGYNDAKAMTQGLDNVIVLPKLKRPNFVGTLRGADLHYGSSGGSSFAESMVSGNKFVLPESWKKLQEEMANPLRQRLRAENSQFNLPDISGNASKDWLDRVNAGQLQFAKSRGVPLVNPNNPADIIKALDDDALGHRSMGSAQRYLRELDLSQGRFKNLVQNVAQESERVHRYQNLGKILGSIPLLGAGAHGIYGYLKNQSRDAKKKQMKKESASKKKEEDNPYIAPVAMGTGAAALAAAPLLAEFQRKEIGPGPVRFPQGNPSKSIPQTSFPKELIGSKRNLAALLTAALGSGLLGYGMYKNSNHQTYLIRSALR